MSDGAGEDPALEGGKVDETGAEPDQRAGKREPEGAGAASAPGPDEQGCYVLDASALLCLMNDESGAARVAAVLPRAVVSTVNLAEVATKLSDLGANAEEARAPRAPAPRRRSPR